jgi:hypothetical protein
MYVCTGTVPGTGTGTYYITIFGRKLNTVLGTDS